MTDLAARYGRRTAAPRTRRAWWIAGVAALTLVVGALWWISSDPLSPTVQSQDISHAVVDDSTIEVRFAVTVDPGTPVTCAVQALDLSYGIVGWVEVPLEAAEVPTSTHAVQLRTAAPAANGLVSECWVP
ncbi:DUF4307 domain-containing protein [Agrococcus terreus]|uniref:DUF4307 domain-containing protein n=1 Tax=Agrococcus terreus TaxID=574649 RepID=A0ABQ2KE08_9MICO|nr:DUF4307 domain-containing protein [Agrococcus terreus]GGN80687.1 hypothetical protein GCM10010968_08780 [Agrococcus terreus]